MKARSPAAPSVLALAFFALASCGTPATSERKTATPPAARQPADGAKTGAVQPKAPSFEWKGAKAGDWLSWRGPQQNGTSSDAGLPDRLDPDHPLWSAPISGRGTPVVADGRVYLMG